MRRRRREPDDLAKLVGAALAAGRIAIGLGIWLAPRLTLKLLGFPNADGKALALGRIAATRDLVVGGWMAASLNDRKRLRDAAAGAAVCDAGDTLTFVLMAASGGELTGGGVRGIAAAGPATAAGAWLHDRLS